MALYTDLRELKKLLEIDPANTKEDLKLSLIITYVSAWIEELLNRPGLTYKSRTEFYNGTGTRFLNLRARPVYTNPLPQVFLDDMAFWGEAPGSFDAVLSPLTWGVDFALKLDQEDGSSRSGILVRNNELWPRPQVRQAGLLSPFIADATGNIKVIYTAGYSVDTLPGQIRMAADLLVMRLRTIMPLGVETDSESYEERSLSVVTSEKAKLLSLVRPLVMSFRNWKF